MTTARRAALLAGLAVLAASSAPAAAAPPEPLGQAVVACSGGTYTPTFDTYSITQGTPGQVGLQRLSVTSASGFGSGSATWLLSGESDQPLAPGAILWGRTGDLGGDILASAGVCQSGDQLTVEAFAVPTMPTSFSGRNGAATTTFKATAPAFAPYVMDVQIQGGPIQITTSTGDNPTTVVSSGAYPLRFPIKGTYNFGVRALSPTQVSWTIGLRAAQVPLSAPAATHNLIRPGEVARVPFSTGGETTVTARVLSAATGVPVRNLGVFQTTDSSYEALWDGRDDLARPVPDGPYVVELVSTDPSGLGGRLTQTVTVDGTAPVAQLVVPVIRPGDPLSLRLADAISGIAKRSIRLDGRPISGPSLATGPDGVLRHRPRRGDFEIGVHRLELSATDLAGNTAKVSEQLRVRGPAFGRLRTARRPGELRVSFTPGLSGPTRIDVRAHAVRLNDCRGRVVAGIRTSCRVVIPLALRRTRLSIGLTLRSSALGTRASTTVHR